MWRSVFGVLLSALIGKVAPSAHAAEPDDSVFLLPPVEVTAKLQTTPWRYVNIGGVEVLSSCSEQITRQLIQREYVLTQLFAALVPPEYQVRLSVPKIIVLSDQKRTLSASQELVAGLSRNTPTPTASGAKGKQGSVRFMPNLRLNDVDAVAVFAMIDESRFNANQLGLTSAFGRFMLEHRTPPLPAWLIEGFAALIGQAQFGGFTVLFPPLTWRSIGETEQMKKDPDFPRTLLPIRDVLEKGPRDFASVPDTLRQWQSQAALFIRWALEGDEERWKSFWSYVSRSGPEQTSEALFRESFGLSYADVRDHLSDYLPQAITQPARLQMAKPPELPRFQLRIATDAEVARIKGEWERLVVVHVRTGLPQYAARYDELAARTLGLSTGPDARNPSLLAVRGLYASDAGKDAEALPLLEAAAAAKVVRPRVYFELARLRYIAALAAGTAGRLSAAQANGVLEPLRMARAQQPPLPQTYALAAEVWRNSDVRLGPQHIELLDEGLRLFPTQLTVLYQVAALKAQQGEAVEARTLIERGERISASDASRSAFQQLRKLLPAVGP